MKTFFYTENKSLYLLGVTLSSGLTNECIDVTNEYLRNVKLLICTVLPLELKKKYAVINCQCGFDSESLQSHPSLFKLQTD